MSTTDQIKALSQVLAILESLEVETRERVMQTVFTFFKGAESRSHEASFEAVNVANLANLPRTRQVPFTESLDITPKDFLLQKAPASAVERVACLAFYLTHYRNIQHFKTSDITKLNMEAAQPRFANPAKSVSNAVQYGYLAAAGKSLRQLSARGEQFVLALPDRGAAKHAWESIPSVRRNRPRKKATKVSEPISVAAQARKR